uniref:G-protein coupled receptors family 1 profile domain-containing protein n=1 Tax=Strigamia maritima TaxID=126957 RepID=T1J5H4_STRMM
MITAVWISSCLLMTPIAVLSTLQPIKRSDKFKCREAWPQNWSEQGFNVILILFLLVIPLVIMIVTYSLIIECLKKGLNLDEKCKTFSKNRLGLINGSSDLYEMSDHFPQQQLTSIIDDNNAILTLSPRIEKQTMQNLRHSNIPKSLANTKRVIKMLFVVVLEFFVFWTPLYVVNTIALFDPVALYSGLGIGGISLCHLMAYASSCCNPITYCFMNLRFRRAFLLAFRCRYPKRNVLESDTTKSTP